MRGGILGLRGNTLSFPLTTKVVTSYATNRVGDMPFTSVALFSDLEAPLHSDRNNAKGFDNFLIGISEFQGGELWIERHGSAAPAPLPHSHLLGVALPVSGQCVIFDAHLRHATMPWVGHRAVLAGFVIKGYEAISSSDHCALIKLGFNTPDLSTGDLVRHGDLASLERPRFVAPAVPVVFELLSGSGLVTACLRKLGLHAAHGIDHVVVPEAASSPLIADLTTEEGQQLASFWITNPLLSQQCLQPRLVAHAVGSGKYPWRTLRILGLSRCEMHCTLTVSRPCKESVSNVLRLPTALMPSWPRLQPCATAEEFSSRVKTHIDPGSGTHPFDHCAFGGHRPKRTTIASSLDCFSSLSKSCPGESQTHTHLPWGVSTDGFATKAEAAYPPPLAAEIATAIARHLVSCDWRPPGALPQPSTLLAACRAMANDQPKASKFPALVPVHCAVILVRGPSQSLANLPCAPMARLKAPWPIPADCSCTISSIPADAQLLRTTPLSVNRGTTPHAMEPRFED